MKFSPLIIGLLLICTGCASTIDNNVHLNQISIEYGATTKTEISNSFGLPSKVRRHGDLETWSYNEKARLSGLILALPTSTSGNSIIVDTFNVTTSPSNPQIEPENIAFVFNKDDKLVNIVDTREISK